MKQQGAAQRDEGGHMSCTSGRIVRSPSAGVPFTAVMTREDGGTFEVSFATMGEAEAFISAEHACPGSPIETYDHDPD